MNDQWGGAPDCAAFRPARLFSLWRRRTAPPLYVFSQVPGPDTRVVRVSLAQLDDSQKDQDLAAAVAEAAEGWVSALSAALTVGRQTPKLSQKIKEGETLDLEPGGTVHSGTRLVWILQVDGTTRFMGRDDLSVVRQGHYVPLPQNTWLEAIENSRLHASRTVRSSQSGDCPAAMSHGFPARGLRICAPRPNTNGKPGQSTSFVLN